MAKKPQKRRKVRPGAVFLTKVKKHKRRVPGKLKKRKIKSFTRIQRNFGPAKPIRKQFIYSIRLLFDVKGQKDIDKRFSKIIFGSKEQFVKAWQQLPAIVESGIIGGMQIWERDHVKKVPQKSGTLRKVLTESVLDNEPKGKFKFPYMMRVGVNLKYASILEAYDKGVQVQHSPGRTRSSGRSYFADKGDPDAERHFFTNFKPRIRKSTKQGIEEAAARKKIPYDQITFFLLESPPFL